MEPSVELEPTNTLLVLGPEFATSLLQQQAATSNGVPPVGYAALKRELDQYTSLKEDDTASLMDDQLKTLSEHRLLEQWLNKLFTLQGTTAVQRTPLAHCIAKLQQMGALVAYLYPDTICEEAMQCSSYTLEQVLQWRRNGATDAGILHPFGVYTDPTSLLSAANIQPPLELVNTLKDRVTVCIGFSTEDKEQDVFFQKFLKLVTTYSRYVPLCLSSSNQWSPLNQKEEEEPLLVNIQNINLPQGLCHIGETSKEIANSIDFPPEGENTISLSLVLSNKTGVSNVTKMISKCPGVNFVLMSIITCNGGLELHSLSVRIVKTMMSQFWSNLTSSSGHLIDNGVLCTVFEHGCIMWLTNCGLFLGNHNIGTVLTANDVCKTIPEEQEVGVATKDHTDQSKNSPKLKSKPIPRWFTTKQKVSLKNTNLLKEDGSPLPNGILHRRLSLPAHPSPLPPPQHIKTKHSASVSISNRQQLLISKYLFTRKHRDSDPASNSSMLRQLLQEKPKEFPKPDTSAGSPSDMIQKWTIQRRKDLFVKENSDWSANIQDTLSRKMAKWERLRQKRQQTLIEKEIKEEVHSPSPSLSSIGAASSTDSLRQQLLSYSTPPQHSPSLSSTSLLQPPQVNPFLLAPSNGGGALPLATPSIIYPTSFLQSSYPFLTALPYMQTVLSPPQTSPTSLILAPTVPSIVTPTAPVTNTTLQQQVTTLQQPSPLQVKTTSANNGLLHRPYSSTNTNQISYSNSGSTTPYLIANSTTSSNTSTRKAGKKHTISHTPSSPTPSSSTSSSSSYISSLLRQDTSCLPETKKRKIVPMDRSDGEDERSMSPLLSASLPDNSNLWQFLLDLLLMNTHSECIQWNPHVTLEFEIKRPKEVAKLWNNYICNGNLKDYSKFSQALEYCCLKSPPVLYKVENGRPCVYRFSHSVLYYISMRYNQQAQNNEFTTSSGKLDQTRRKLSRSREVLVVD